ncbi:hypothetical protein [Afipia carboxidovorans]|uniref:hypothetical protein n=1 Tax=Afipia carboxidovorans TaxID=40137 RepID=UPI0030CE5B7F
MSDGLESMMGKEYFVSGSRFDLEHSSVVLQGRRSASGPEIDLRIPVGTLLSLAMHCRRAIQGQRAMATQQVADGWKKVHPLPVRTAQVLATDDQTLGACLLALDSGTDAELQLSFPTIEFVRQLGNALLAAADEGAAKPQSVN